MKRPTFLSHVSSSKFYTEIDLYARIPSKNEIIIPREESFSKWWRGFVRQVNELVWLISIEIRGITLDFTKSIDGRVITRFQIYGGEGRRPAKSRVDAGFGRDNGAQPWVVRHVALSNFSRRNDTDQPAPLFCCNPVETFLPTSISPPLVFFRNT